MCEGADCVVSLSGEGSLESSAATSCAPQPRPQPSSSRYRLHQHSILMLCPYYGDSSAMNSSIYLASLLLSSLLNSYLKEGRSI